MPDFCLRVRRISADSRFPAGVDAIFSPVQALVR